MPGLYLFFAHLVGFCNIVLVKYLYKYDMIGDIKEKGAVIMGIFDRIFKKNKTKPVDNIMAKPNNIAPREAITKTPKIEQATINQKKRNSIPCSRSNV